jgi:hypothetical protein
MAMAMSTRTSTDQTHETDAPEAYEPPTLVKHGSLGELTLMGMPTSGGGKSPWGKKHHKGHWGA